MPTIIVFCHLRWDFVFQRPQHLLTRLANHYKIVLVEEPIHHEGENFLHKREVAPNVTVCQPHTNIAAPGFHDDQIPSLKPLLSGLVSEGEAPIVWFYTPMALPLLQDLHPSLVVYDCMDEWEGFPGMRRAIHDAERTLVRACDLLVVTAQRLYDKWKSAGRPIVLARNAAAAPFLLRRFRANDPPDQHPGDQRSPIHDHRPHEQRRRQAVLGVAAPPCRVG